eukprot:Seg2673.1 transcript_id=Seg2673.1/GoldUCD/mRNA.D3Y31 product="hypothetical protein" protein_id=Seg2673.1/GoldUCD/D3Y31
MYPGADTGSDHNPVVMKLNVKLKKLQRKHSRIKLDMNSLKAENIKNRFVAEVNNRTAIYTEETHQYEPEEIDNYWKDVRTGLNDAAKTVIPKKNHDKKQKWMTDEILGMMKERKENKNDIIKY